MTISGLSRPIRQFGSNESTITDSLQSCFHHESSELTEAWVSGHLESIYKIWKSVQISHLRKHNTQILCPRLTALHQQPPQLPNHDFPTTPSSFNNLPSNLLLGHPRRSDQHPEPFWHNKPRTPLLRLLAFKSLHSRSRSQLSIRHQPPAHQTMRSQPSFLLHELCHQPPRPHHRLPCHDALQTLHRLLLRFRQIR